MFLKILLDVVVGGIVTFGSALSGDSRLTGQRRRSLFPARTSFAPGVHITPRS